MEAVFCNSFLSEDEMILDLTGNQLKNISDVHLPPTLTEIDLTSNRLKSIDDRIATLQNLRKISFRQNLLNDSACHAIGAMKSSTALLELVLRDNVLQKVPPVAKLSNLLLLDLSYNEIASMAGLTDASNSLTELYLANNQISRIEEISHLTALELLELGSNRIRSMEGLGGLTSLKELWLGRNKISTVDLCGISLLEKVSLQSNRLTTMAGFEACTNLQELYLSHNGISELQGLDSLQQLRVLDISSNRIKELCGVHCLTRLEDLWINDNQIESVDNVVENVVGSSMTLTTLYMENNSFSLDGSTYLRFKKILPCIQQIDSQIFS